MEKHGPPANPALSDPAVASALPVSSELGGTEIFGILGQRMVPGPQAFVSGGKRGRPYGTTPPHWHYADQFQVFTEGGYKMGERDLRPIAVQYVDAYTTYGPLFGGAHGITCFTLRAEADIGPEYEPGMEGRIEYESGRNLLAHVDGDPDLDIASTEVTPIIPLAKDGMGAWTVKLPGNATYEGIRPDQGAGLYYLVSAGSVRVQGEELPRWSCIWLDPQDETAHFTAGAEGACLIVMQHPRKRTAPNRFMPKGGEPPSASAAGDVE